MRVSARHAATEVMVTVKQLAVLERCRERGCGWVVACSPSSMCIGGANVLRRYDSRRVRLIDAAARNVLSLKWWWSNWSQKRLRNGAAHRAIPNHPGPGARGRRSLSADVSWARFTRTCPDSVRTHDMLGP